MGRAGEIEELSVQAYGNTGTTGHLDGMRYHPSSPFYPDEYFNETLARAATEMDSAKRNALLKELGIYVIGEAYTLGIAEAFELCYWWPWVKNYYSEVEVGHTNPVVINAAIWIDQALKAEMGYWVAALVLLYTLPNPGEGGPSKRCLGPPGTTGLVLWCGLNRARRE